MPRTASWRPAPRPWPIASPLARTFVEGNTRLAAAAAELFILLNDGQLVRDPGPADARVAGQSRPTDRNSSFPATGYSPRMALGLVRKTG